MLGYLIKKLLFFFLTLLLVVTLTFVLMKTIPGDPFINEKGIHKELHQLLNKQHGFDQPILSQYIKFVIGAFTFNLGNSLKYENQNVNHIILETFPISATLGIEALILSLFVGISFGVISAIKQNKWPDRLIMIFASIGISIPSFILAVFLQYILAIRLGILPLARYGSFAQTIMPVLALSIMPIAYISRLVRSNLIEVLKSDYIKTAHSKGLSNFQIIRKHALKNSLTPLIPYFAQLTASILLGSFVVEKIFAIPGLGKWFVDSVSSRDYPMIMALTLFYSFILLLLVFLADILYRLLDPRTKEKT